MILRLGIIPEKRSGHQACAIEKKLYIFGGLSNSTQFQDMYTLDTAMDPPTWSRLQNTLNQQIWSHVACSIVSIPNWKIFTFGGFNGVLSDQNRFGIASNDVQVLDSGNNEWSFATISG